ncbi:GmrSD restriction endonuclease domain-containing protein [Corynebacterium lubricantis]|uniref:GmrSD restriction endonuclease domain-containing protein n=1 Tax=Corynebacterium lubricantis TaxID=541095 RepID=UPI0003647173|nr:DUF262 domain-containing protein [Corynebacterium lubricantis]
MGFTTPSYSLTDLFERIDRSELQIPDFQREVSWDIDRIRSLVATVLRGYPVGSLLALDTRNTDTPFKPRPVAGAPDRGVAPGLLLLDGQQRVTALYHSLQGEGFVQTLNHLGNPIDRKFFVDVRLATSTDPLTDEAIFTVDREGRIRSHFGPSIPSGVQTTEQMIENYIVPVSSLLGEEGNDLLFEMAASTDDPEIRTAVKKFHNSVLRRLTAYDIPMVRLDRDTPQRGVGQIFAQANSIGQPMDVFELLTAVFAKSNDNFRLADHWAEISDYLRQFRALDGIGRMQFLRAVALLVTSRQGQAMGHRGDILNLTLDEYLGAAEDLKQAFANTAEFLAERRIFTTDQVPYTTQLVPLAVILARLAETPGLLESKQANDRVSQWFWSVVFSELYAAASPTIRSGRDVDQVTEWIRSGTDEVPKSLNDAEFHESRLLTAGPESGVYRGFFALLMARGAKDLRTGDEFTAETYDELEPGYFHVFPLQYCEQIGVDDQLAHSVLNLTPMGKRTEIVVDGGEPKRYLRRIQAKSIMEDDEFDDVLSTHEMEPSYLFSSNWKAFFQDRWERFLGIVEYAMDKPVIRDVEPNGAPENAPNDEAVAEGSEKTGEAAQGQGES